MKIMSKLILMAFCMPLFLFAQGDDKAKSRIVELSYMKAKVGMEAKFEAAIKKHNEKFHKEGVYEAALYAISTGNESGWYVWGMGGFTFTDLDNRPAGDDHAADWDKNVAQYIAEYGRVEYWRWNDKLSLGKESDEKMIQVWWLDINRGEYYRFENAMKLILEVNKKMDSEIGVYNKQFGQNDGRDVALSWPIENWAEFDNDDWEMKTEFDKMYGEGSWDDLLEEWKDAVNMRVSELWRIVK